MLGTSHKILGAAAGVLVAETLKVSIFDNPAVFTGIVLISTLGSLLPDADQPNSTIGKELYFVWLPIYLIRGIIKILSLIIFPLKGLAKALGHRGIAHWPFFWALLAVPLWYTPFIRQYTFVFYALMAGIASHLLADFVFGGLPLGIPFTTKKIYPVFKFKTGSVYEYIICGVAAIWLIKVGIHRTREFLALIHLDGYLGL